MTSGNGGKRTKAQQIAADKKLEAARKKAAEARRRRAANK